MYLPTTLTSEDYPNLVAPGEQVDTVATSVLLAAFNWPANTERYARVAKFVNAFFSKIDEFQKPPRHPKWRESSISIVVPGWTRLKAAQDWLDANSANASQADFAAFMERTGKRNVPPAEMDRLYARLPRMAQAHALIQAGEGLADRRLCVPALAGRLFRCTDRAVNVLP